MCKQSAIFKVQYSKNTAMWHDTVPWNTHVTSQLYQTRICDIFNQICPGICHWFSICFSTCHSAPFLVLFSVTRFFQCFMYIYVRTAKSERLFQHTKAPGTELLWGGWGRSGSVAGVGGCGKLKGRSRERTFLGFPLAFSYSTSACTSSQHCPMPSITTRNTPLEKLCIYCNIFLCHLKNYCCSCF